VRADLPNGTVTFLFTDVEGSTTLLRALGAERYAEALASHRSVVRAACAAAGGVEVDTQGDAFFLVFPSAAGAVDAARAISAALEASSTPVRMGLHTGTALVTGEGYVGGDVHVAARIAAAAHGGQVVVSAATRELGGDAAFVGLGSYRLKDLPEPLALYQLGDRRFPPLRAVSSTNLPRPTSSLVGRGRELDEVLRRIELGARLITLSGPGGTGKTRLALEAAAALVPAYDGGVFWVALSTVRDPDLVTTTIAQTLGAASDPAGHIGQRRLLLLLDNLEQVVDAAPALAGLVAACPNLCLLVTSRERLRVQGEVEYAVPPLSTGEAVRLFCERSQLPPTAEVAELCARLDSLPLAIELAAARARALSPARILERLSQRLDLLRGGRDADPRQQTLRATVDWSYALLTPAEQELFARLSVFAGGCTLEAAEEVAGADVETLQALVEKSLVRFSGERYWLLETIREFAAERLDEDGREGARRRHRAYVVRLVEETADRLHTGDEQAAAALLAPDYPNVAAAVDHALESREPDDVGTILGGLYPFLISRGSLTQATSWTNAALALRDLLSERGLADLLTGGGEIARFSGDLDRAVELKEELMSAGAEPRRPNWRAATLVDLAEIALDRGDFAAARRNAGLAAEVGAGPRAELCFAELALREGRLDGSEEHGRSALAAFEEGSFNFATCLELLAETARRSGRESLAAERFAAALRLFAGLGDAGGTADCLDGLARLAAAAGDAQRTGVLAGAAEGLRETRRRAPIRADVPRPEAPEPARAAGRGLTLEQAVAYAVPSLAGRK